MPQFFHGWRRKIGVMSLVMACAWSFVWYTGLYSPFGFQIPKTIRAGDAPPGIYYRINVAKNEVAINRYRFVPMGSMTSVKNAGNLTIPHWSIALPLALLSAYLLITKPRVAKPKTIVENSVPD